MFSMGLQFLDISKMVCVCVCVCVCRIWGKPCLLFALVREAAVLQLPDASLAGKAKHIPSILGRGPGATFILMHKEGPQVFIV